MLKKIFSIILVLVICSVLLVGCKKKSESEEVTAITSDDAKQIAEDQINEENLDEELDKIQSEIESDQ